MVRVAWLVSKEEVPEADKTVELEEFLRSVMTTDEEAARAGQIEAGASVARPPHDELDDALEALDDEVLNDEVLGEEPAPGEAERVAVDEHLPDEALREVPPRLETPMAAPDDRLDVKGTQPEAPVQLQPQSLVLDDPGPDDRDRAPREAPAFEPRPRQLDELLDEALSETFPASDPIAVSADR
jgi:hypothetical protein